MTLRLLVAVAYLAAPLAAVAAEPRAVRTEPLGVFDPRAPIPEPEEWGKGLELPVAVAAFDPKASEAATERWEKLERVVLAGLGLQRASRAGFWLDGTAAHLRDEPSLPLERALSRAFAAAHSLDQDAQASVEAALSDHPPYLLRRVGRPLLRGEARRVFAIDGTLYSTLTGSDGQTRLFRREGARWAAEPGLPSGGVEVLETIDGTLHAAGPAIGLWTRGQQGWTRALSKPVTALRSFEGRLYVGTDRGLDVRDGGRWRSEGLAGQRVNSLVEHDGRLFAVTSHGFFESSAPDPEDRRAWAVRPPGTLAAAIVDRLKLPISTARHRGRLHAWSRFGDFGEPNAIRDAVFETGQWLLGTLNAGLRIVDSKLAESLGWDIGRFARSPSLGLLAFSRTVQSSTQWSVPQVERINLTRRVFPIHLMAAGVQDLAEGDGLFYLAMREGLFAAFSLAPGWERTLLKDVSERLGTAASPRPDDGIEAQAASTLRDKRGRSLLGLTSGGSR